MLVNNPAPTRHPMAIYSPSFPFATIDEIISEEPFPNANNVTPLKLSYNVDRNLKDIAISSEILKWDDIYANDFDK